MESKMSKYSELRAIDVNSHIEKKNGLSYLSWAWAVDTLLSQDETATWEYKEPKQFGETLMVFCTVTAFGKSMTAQLPVMDYRNKAIINPDSYSVNTAMQRCLAKAIALHGLGLYIYAGEDIPQEIDRKEALKNGQILPPDASAKSITKDVYDSMSIEEQIFINDIAMEIIAAYSNADLDECCRLFYANNLINDEQTAVWSKLDSKQRSSIKTHNETLKKAGK
jgi:hypothetical protein